MGSTPIQVRLRIAKLVKTLMFSWGIGVYAKDTDTQKINLYYILIFPYEP